MNHLAFDRIAKTRWLVEMLVKVPQEIYNLNQDITIDECVISYKDWYYFIRKFMPIKHVETFCLEAPSKHMRV